MQFNGVPSNAMDCSVRCDAMQCAILLLCALKGLIVGKDFQDGRFCGTDSVSVGGMTNFKKKSI